MPEFKTRAPQELPSAALERRRHAAIDDLITTWDCASMTDVTDDPADDDEPLTPEEAKQHRIFQIRIAALVGLSEQNASITGVELLEHMRDANERWLVCEGWVTQLMKDPDRQVSARTIADIIVRTLPDELPPLESYGRAFTSEEVRFRLLGELAFIGGDTDKERLIRLCKTVLDRLDDHFLRNQVLGAWDITDYEPFHDAVQSYAEAQEDAVNRFRILCELAHHAGSIQDIRAAVIAGIRLLQRPQAGMTPKETDHEIKKVLRACGRKVLKAGHPRHLIPEGDCEDLHAALATHPKYQVTLDAALRIGKLSLIAEANERDTNEKS